MYVHICNVLIYSNINILSSHSLIMYYYDTFVNRIFTKFLVNVILTMTSDDGYGTFGGTGGVAQLLRLLMRDRDMELEKMGLLPKINHPAIETLESRSSRCRVAYQNSHMKQDYIST